jgi:hypothetical protein
MCQAQASSAFENTQPIVAPRTAKAKLAKLSGRIRQTLTAKPAILALTSAPRKKFIGWVE